MCVLNQHLYLSPAQYCLLKVTSDQLSQTNNQQVELIFEKITTYVKYLIADHQVPPHLSSAGV